MLQHIKKWSQSWLAKGLLGVLILSFAAWGITDYLTSSGSTTALTVNGQTISVYKLDRNYRQMLNSFQAQVSGLSITPELAQQLNLPGQALSEIIRTELVLQKARKMGLVAADEQVAQLIHNNPEFQTDGQFDADRYKMALRSIGYTVEGYEQALREDILLGMMDQMFNATVADPAVAQDLLVYDDTSANLAVLAVTADDLPKLAPPAEASITAVYEQNRSQMLTPERRDVLLLTLPMSPDQYTQSVAVEDALAGGQSLAEAAANLELTTQAVNGLTGNDTRLPAAVVEAAFNTASGQTSRPQTLDNEDMVYIYVSKAEAPRELTLEEVRPQLVQQLQGQQRQGQLAVLAQKVAASAAKNGLAAAKREFNLNGTVQTHKGLKRQDQALPWLRGPVAALVFASKPGSVLPLPVSHQGQQLVVQVTSVEQPDPAASRIADATQGLAAAQSNDLRWLYLYNLFTEARISYNLPALRQIFGAEFNLTQVPVPPRKGWQDWVPFVK